MNATEESVLPALEKGLTGPLMNDLSIILDKITKERDLYLKRGLELARYPHQSEDVKEVFSAFAAAQKEFPSITKGKQGYGYKYTELSSLLSVVIPILTEHGLLFTQYVTREVMLHTRIAHVSGQFFESQCKIPIPTQEEFTQMGKKTSYMQEVGSRRTYLRRYEAFSVLGIHPEGEDQDGR